MSRHRGTAKQGGTQALVDLTAAVKQVNKTKKLPRMLEGKNKAGPKGWGSSRRSCISNGCSEEASLRGDLGEKWEERSLQEGWGCPVCSRNR